MIHTNSQDKIHTYIIAKSVILNPNTFKERGKKNLYTNTVASFFLQI